MSRWRIGVAAGEGVRAALAGRWLSAALVLLVCWAAAVPGGMDAAAVSDLVADEQRFLDAGGGVVVASVQDGRLPALACERLSDAQGVRAAVALRHLGEPVTVSAARGGDLPVFAASSTAWRLLEVTGSPARDTIVPASTAERLGVRDGDWLQFEQSPGTSASLAPADPVRVTVADMQILGEQYTGVLMPTPFDQDAQADACVVAAAPAQVPALRGALASLLPSESGQTIVRDRLITGEFTVDHSTAYQDRQLRWAWAPVGLLLGVVWLVLRWMRRGDDALYATMGADLSTRLMIRGSEWALLAGIGAAWALTVGTVLAVNLGSTYPLAVTYVGRTVAASLLVATALVLLGQLRRPRSLLADLKDR